MKILSLFATTFICMTSSLGTITNNSIETNTFKDVDTLCSYNDTGVYYSLRSDISFTDFFTTVLIDNYLVKLSSLLRDTHYTFNSYDITYIGTANYEIDFYFNNDLIVSLTDYDFEESNGYWVFYDLEGTVVSDFDFDEYFSISLYEGEVIDGVVNPYIEINDNVQYVYARLSGELTHAYNGGELSTRLTSFEYIKGTVFSIYTENDEIEFDKTINPENGNAIYSIYPLHMGTFPYVTTPYFMYDLTVSHNSYVLVKSLLNKGLYNQSLYLSEYGSFKRTVGFPSYNLQLDGTFKHNNRYYDHLSITHTMAQDGSFHFAVVLNTITERITLLTIEGNNSGYTVEKVDNLLIDFININIYQDTVYLIVTNFFTVYKSTDVLGGPNVNNGSDIFGLFSQAFESFASILNLQIFAGITLGTLLFIPFIGMVLFFILNLFKR